MAYDAFIDENNLKGKESMRQLDGFGIPTDIIQLLKVGPTLEIDFHGKFPVSLEVDLESYYVPVRD